MFSIDDTLKEFIESGVATVVATGDGERRPHVAMGWAPRVPADGLVDVFLDAARAEQTLANLQSNGHIAMTAGHPVSYRSVQLKGTFRESGEPSAEERDWVQQQREAFAVSTALIGDPPAVIRNLWMDEVVRVRFAVERAFDQTPGPEAGQPL